MKVGEEKGTSESDKGKKENQDKKEPFCHCIPPVRNSLYHILISKNIVVLFQIDERTNLRYNGMT